MIPAGLTTGLQADARFVSWWQSRINPRWITAVVLFLMTFTLDSSQFLISLKKPRPVLLAGLINLGLLPLVACGLSPLQISLDFQVGLMIAATVPCTLAAASVWTRKAGGNDAVSLLVTLTTNSICVIVTPFWLSISTAQSVQFDLGQMTLRLVQAVLIPTLAGQLLRLIPANAQFAKDYKIPIGVIAQTMILLLVMTAAMRAGRQLNGGNINLGPTAFLWVWLNCLFLHLFGAGCGWWGSRSLGIPLVDRKAILFAASQKTLPIGVLLATEETMFGAAGVPFAIFPMLMYHTTQLIVDTLIAHRLSNIKQDEFENSQRD